MGTVADVPGESTGRVLLKTRQEARLLGGHQWVFSNEIDSVEGEPVNGGVVEVTRRDGRLIGLGYYNAHSLIAVRLLTSRREAIDRGFFVDRIRSAWDRRRLVYPDLVSYRLVHGESDGLPGLIIDKYEDCAVIQTLCLGMDRAKDTICDALEELMRPRCVVERNESHLRRREGLPARRGVLRGETVEPVLIEEDDLRFAVDLLAGQKTGFYFDQRENRFLVRRYASGARVLDVFCHDGAFGLHAARGGASQVLGLDVAPDAVDRARRNASLNGLEDRCRFEAMEANSALEGLRMQGERFDMIILDPPAFTKSRKNVPAAKKGYEDLNRRALRVLRRGGILATSACSFHITEETFLSCIRRAAQRTNRSLCQFEWRTQAPDHPILPGMPETKYLKFGLFEAA
ncbi:MAG: class I SAM-dependent rRNA methyltransferase [Acidobacteriota bacterium]